MSNNKLNAVPGSKEFCKNAILYFLEREGKTNDIDYFKTFKFSDLRQSKYQNYRYENKKFVTCSDEDAMPLTKFIYMLIWGEKLPGFNNAYDVQYGCYGGDTMFPVKNSDFYTNIGNFMLLPKITYNGHISFNTCRYACFRDDFPDFMKEMKNIYEGKSTDIWLKLKEKNEFYFKEINTFEKFMKVNFLEGCPQKSGNMAEVEEFLRVRSEKICEVLKEKPIFF